MKQVSLYIAIAAVVLQGCAGTTNIQGKGTRAMLEGSKPLSLSSEQCPHGLGIIRLYKDTLDGNKTRFNAKFAYTKKPIAEKVNVYNLLDENHKDLIGNEKKASADIDTTSNSILIKLSDQELDRSSTTMGDATSMLKAEDGSNKVKVNDEVSIRYNPQHKYYENWGVVENAALCEVDNGTLNRAILKSVDVKVGKDYTAFPIPDSIDSVSLDKPLDEKFSATIGQPFEIKLSPKTYDVAGIIYVQFTNGLKGKDNATYNFITDEAGLSDGTVKVPTTGIKAGEYIVNIFRSEIMPVDADPETEGNQNFCMEVGTGVMGRIAFEAPKEEKK